MMTRHKRPRDCRRAEREPRARPIFIELPAPRALPIFDDCSNAVLQTTSEQREQLGRPAQPLALHFRAFSHPRLVHRRQTGIYTTHKSASHEGRHDTTIPILEIAFQGTHASLPLTKQDVSAETSFTQASRQNATRVVRLYPLYPLHLLYPLYPLYRRRRIRRGTVRLWL